LKLAVSGATGRMGTQVLKIAEGRNDVFRAVYPVRRFSSFKESVDLVIDFSLPEALEELVGFCESTKTPLVSGTTGFSVEQQRKLKELGRKVPVLWAPNMSLGVMVVSRMLEELKLLSDWTFSIEETHHVHKKDRPSGTALKLKEILERVIHKPLPDPTSFRQGEVIGEHRITAKGPYEEISIEHRATDRRVFAQGAVQAGLWLVSQKPGFYALTDLTLDF